MLYSVYNINEGLVHAEFDVNAKITNSRPEGREFVFPSFCADENHRKVKPVMIQYRLRGYMDTGICDAVKLRAACRAGPAEMISLRRDGE